VLAQVAANFAVTEVQADTVLRFCWLPKRRIGTLSLVTAAATGSANNRQRFEVAVGNSRLLLALNVSYLCRNRRSETSARDGRGRNAGYPAPPAQIPAGATNALGSSFRL